jgi:hypothetical protein
MQGPPSEGVTAGEYVINAICRTQSASSVVQAGPARGKAYPPSRMRWKSTTSANRTALHLLFSAPFLELPPKA